MRVIKISAIIVGTIIGAGFASGKEIFEYFAKYGAKSIIFVIPLFFLLYCFIFSNLKYGNTYGNLSFLERNKILGNYNKFSKKIDYFNIMLFITFLIYSSAMFSALNSLLQTYFDSLNKTVTVLLSIFVTFVLYKLSNNAFAIVSNFVVPLVIICVLITSIYSFKNGNFVSNFGINNVSPLVLLIVSYASQNIFFASFIIINFGKELSVQEQKKVSFLVSLIISILILIGIFCFLFNPNLVLSQLPFIQIAININPIFSIVFGIVLLFSILTTYSSSLKSLNEYFNGSKIYNKKIVMFILIILLGLCNFENIINYFYPIVGMFGIIYFVKIYKINKNY